jgi:hypothetical protein
MPAVLDLFDLIDPRKFAVLELCIEPEPEWTFNGPVAGIGVDVDGK